MKGQWEVTEHKYVDDKISRYRPVQLSDTQKEGLKAIREVLKAVSSRLPGFCFKAYAKVNVVWIVMVKSRHGTQETVASVKAKLSLLDDAVKMAPAVFQSRLEKFLRENSFEI